MRKRITITEGQNLIDLAITYYGTAEAVSQLIADNPSVSINQVMRAGDSLIIDTDNVVNDNIVSYLASNKTRVNTGDVILPIAPNNLTALPEGIGAIRLNWADNSNDEDKFEIFRKQEGGFYEKIAEVSADVETYLDEELLDNTSYTYKVVATNVVGSSIDSNEATAITRDYDLELFFTADAMTVDFTSSAAQDVTWRFVSGAYSLNTHSLPGSLTINQAGGARVRFYFDNVAQVTAISVDDLAQLRSTLEVDDRFTALRTLTARNGNFVLKPGAWVQNANVTLDTENSLVTIANIKASIDNLITANGGDPAALDGEGSYDSAQVGYSTTATTPVQDRVFNIGTSTDPIEFDTEDAEKKLIWEKILALGTTDVNGVGWLITTVKQICVKWLEMNSGDSYDVVTYLEETTEILSTEKIEGDDMIIQLYPSEADAQAMTGLLAEGRAYINAYLESKVWSEGERLGLRAFAIDNLSTGNEIEVKYKAIPVNERGCGVTVSIDSVLSIDADFAYHFNKVIQKNYDGPFYNSINGNDEYGHLLTFFDQSGKSLSLDERYGNAIDVQSDGLIYTGSGSRIEKTLSTPFSLNDFSLSASFLQLSSTGEGGNIIALDTEGGTGSGDTLQLSSYRQNTNDNHKAALGVRMNGGGFSRVLEAGSLIANQINYITYTYSASNSTLKLYVNGDYVDELNIDLSAAQTVHQIRSGKTSGVHTVRTHGAVIHKRVLSIDEIKLLHQSIL
ncbi:LamG-like jellyroll fold domain-containing protein [Algivirga pacifica]|uniref:Fibronectin type-III domain-containing protein n=1 Tax=Algivirga pacifica TaxID=1162670 RepID=A0ABP9D588_9BACT